MLLVYVFSIYYCFIYEGGMHKFYIEIMLHILNYQSGKHYNFLPAKAN